jgi:hypothetical protein
MSLPEKYSYKIWYIAVVVVLVVQIGLYYWFTRYYR